PRGADRGAGRQDRLGGAGRASWDDALRPCLFAAVRPCRGGRGGGRRLPRGVALGVVLRPLPQERSAVAHRPHSPRRSRVTPSPFRRSFPPTGDARQQAAIPGARLPVVAPRLVVAPGGERL